MNSLIPTFEHLRL